jgi:hypothetical protein
MANKINVNEIKGHIWKSCQFQYGGKYVAEVGLWLWVMGYGGVDFQSGSYPTAGINIRSVKFENYVIRKLFDLACIIS